MGTPGYIAPEIIPGAEATPGSDRWAIAATGIEFLTGGRIPGDGDVRFEVLRDDRR